MGGTVLEVKVKPGDAVKAGDTLLVYEAMKMENNLASDRDGVIAKVMIEDGDVMSTDQPLFQFAGAGAPAAAKPAPAPKPAAVPKPVAAPKPAPKAEAPKPAAVVKKVDINRALPSVEGGTAGSNPVPEHHADNAPALKLANGTTLQIDINPDGGISIKITTGN